MLASLALSFAPPPAATTLYVDAAASNANADGTSARPFATLHAARDALRAGVGRNAPRRVHVRGEHFLTEFALDERDALLAKQDKEREEQEKRKLEEDEKNRLRIESKQRSDQQEQQPSPSPDAAAEDEEGPAEQ